MCFFAEILTYFVAEFASWNKMEFGTNLDTLQNETTWRFKKSFTTFKAYVH
jgi:hypothetical protein